MPKFILTADSHLRESQYGIFDRGLDFLTSMKNVVDLAAANDATILHAGDLLDSRDLKGPVAQHLHELDAYCIGKRVRMLVIDGNHDHSDPPWSESLSSYRRALGIAGGDVFGMHSLDHKTEVIDGVRVSGLPFMPVSDFREAVNTIEPCDILLWHGMISEVVGGGNENMASFKDLPVDKFKVFLVGDVHIRFVKQIGGTLCVSPGSTELCSKSEPFEKSVELLHMKNGEVISNKSLSLNTRKSHGFRIMNEQDVSEVIGKLRKMKGRNIVFVSYANGIKDIDKRLRQSIDETQVILRCSTLDNLILPSLPVDGVVPEAPQIFDSADQMIIAIQKEEVMSPAEFLPTLLPDAGLRQIACRMLDDPNPASALGQWLEIELNKLTEQTNVS